MGLFDSIKKFVDNIFGAIGDVLGYVLGIDTDLEDKYKGQLINKSSNIQKIPVIYGERLVGGTRVFVSTGGGKKNQYLYIALVLSEGEVDSIGDIYINDIISTDSRFTNKATIYKYRGTDNQAATTLFADADESWTSAHQLKGVAYLAMRFKYDQDVFTSIPEIRAVVKGKKVYNPATQITEWSDNPALCLRDYLTNPRYGKGLPASAIDDASIIQAASDCDSLVTPYGGATDIPLFKFNAIIDTGETVFDNVKKIIASMRGILPYSNGKYSLLVDKDQSSTFTLTEDNILSDIKIVSSSKENKFNQVTAKFPNPAKRWELDTVTYPDSGSTEETAFLNEDNQQILSKEITLHNVTNAYRAKDLARIACLASRRQSLTVSVTCTSEALNIAVGDIVTIEHDSLGWTGTAVQEFRVMGMVLDDSGEVDLTLQQYDASIYPWVEQSEIPDNPETTLPDPFTTAPVTNQSGTGQAVVQNDGTVTYFYDLEWDEPDDALVEYYLIDVNKTIDEVETLAAETLQTQNLNFRYMVSDTSIDYGFTIRAVNGAGTRSAGVTIPASSVIKDTTPPSVIDAQTTSVVAGLQSITVSWENPTEEDFDLVRIKVNDTNTEPTSHFAATRSDTFIHDIGEYSTIKYYWIAPVDTSGNVADYTFAGSATTGSIDYGDVLNPPTIPEVATTAYLTLADNDAPTDAEFNTAVGRDPIENDFVVVNKEFAFNYNGTAWVAVTEFIDGSLLVSGSLSASDITTGTLNANDVTISNLTVAYDTQVTGTPDLSVYLTDGDIEDFVTLEDVNQSSFAPYQSWDFRNTSDGWTVGGITTANNTDFITLTSTSTDPTFNKTGLSIDGGLYDTVLVRIRRTAGTGWQGTLYYSTSGHGASESYRQIVPDTTVLNEWVILTYDMYNLNAGGDDWKNNTITALRFDWGNATPDDVFDVDWVSVGKRGSIPISQTDISEFITGGDVNANVTSISGGVIQAGTAITVGTGDNVAVLSGSDATYRLWAGDASSADAPFKVSQTGVLYATGAEISGNITAGSIDAENITFTGSLIADGLSTIPNVEALNMTQSLRNAIEEIIVTKFGSDASTGYYDEATGSFDAQDDNTEICRINTFQHNGSDIDIDVTFSRSWQASSNDIPSVTVNIQRSVAGANSWTTIKTQTITGAVFYEPELNNYFANIQGVVSITDNPTAGNYDYRFFAGTISNLSLISINARLEANEQGEQIGTIDLANYGALAQDETVTGNWTFDNSLSMSTDARTIYKANSLWGALLSVGGNGHYNNPLTASIAVTSGNLHIDASPDDNSTEFGIYLNFYKGSLGTIFGGGAGNIVARMDTSGNLYKATTTSNITATYYHTGNFTDNSSNWNTAYGWGNHASSGYAPLANPAFTGNISVTAGSEIRLAGASDSVHKIYHDATDDYDVINVSTGFRVEHYTDGDLITSVSSSTQIHNDLIVGNSTSASNLIVNDINGAKYKIATGGYDLKFQKHDADNATYATAMELRGTNANDGVPTVYVNNGLFANNYAQSTRFYNSIEGSSSNAKNHFTQYNAGTASMSGGWIASAFGKSDADRVVIGQSSSYGSGAIIGSHNGALNAWSSLNYVATEHKFFSEADPTNPRVTISSGGRITSSQMQLNSVSPLTFTGAGSGTYTLSAIYVDVNTMTIEAPLSTDAPSGAHLPLIMSWRGGYNSQGGIKLGDGYAIVDSLQIKTASVGTGVTVIDSSKSLVNINNISMAGQFKFSGNSGLTGSGSPEFANISGYGLKLSTNKFGICPGSGTSETFEVISQRFGQKDGSASLYFGQWDGANNRIESAGRNLLITTYTGSIKLGISGGTSLTVTSSGITSNGTLNGTAVNAYGAESHFAGSTYSDPDSGIGRDAKFGQNGIAVNGGIKLNSGNQVMNGNSYTLYGPNSTWSRYLQVGGNGRQYVNSTTVASVATTDGNLHIDCASGKGTYLNYYDGNIVYFGSGSNGLVGYVDNSGNANFNGNITAYSDVTLKDNIELIPNALYKVCSVRGVTYERIDQNNVRQTGVIAQEIEAILPEAVQTDENGIKAVAYGNMVGILIEAIKELKSEIEELKNGVN